MGKATLVIMAAGIGSRFGGGIKQLEPVGPNRELIIDYSIHDAVEAGFDKVVFVIRKDLEKDFKEVIGNRIERKIKVEYAFQEIDDIPEKYRKKFPERKKPWGTGQAILCCKDCVKEPFLVINADDYYGKSGYKKAFDYLVSMKTEEKLSICMVGFILENTLSENGGVTRGVCHVDDELMLTDIVETSNIIKVNGGAFIEKEAGREVIDSKSVVSMNMWGFLPRFFEVLEREFGEFLENIGKEDMKAEYLLPTIVGDLLKDDMVAVKVLKSEDKWFGVTYREDKDSVVESIKEMVYNGLY